MSSFLPFIERPLGNPITYGSPETMYVTQHWEAQPSVPGKVEIALNPAGSPEDTGIETLVVEARHYTGPIFSQHDNTGYTDYYKHVGITSAYQRKPNGESFTEVTYLHPEETIGLLADLPTAVGFEIYDGGEFSLQALTQGIAKRQIPMANQGASMAHDMLTHIHTWAFAPEQSIEALAAKAEYLLKKGKYAAEAFGNAVDGTMNSPAVGELIALAIKNGSEGNYDEGDWEQAACMIDMIATPPRRDMIYSFLPPALLKRHVFQVINSVPHTP